MQYIRNAFEIVLMLIALVIICFFLAYAWPDAKYGLAAWVQAVGSITAILGAFTIARMQTQREREAQQERRNDLRANRILLAVMHGLHVRKILNEFEVALSKKTMLNGAFEYQEHRLAIALRGLESISFEDLHEGDAHCIARTVIMVSDLYSGMISKTGAHTKESLRETVNKFNTAIINEMAILARTYEAVTGRPPVP
ncbi:hypothetical protein [Rugamonas apoptosis]|uniref:Uncharacterized protein n=1 Tax=Rugamonas apoptosis TaxID=2758570 RepID=A0A7W2IK26_9BURK|nr:hypothetical protein [Rugamonas apoptosis]MBA5686957.1 hypothetical protein [Rugamonas apoptosis]